MIRVLMVDDDPAMLKVAKIFLERSQDMKVGTTESARGAMERLSDGHYDVIVSDYMMPEMDGISFLKWVRVQDSDIPFILFTGKGREEVVIEAINNGADYYLQKDTNPKVLYTELAHQIRQAAERRRTKRVVLESEEKYRSLFENMNEGFVLYEFVRDGEKRPHDYVIRDANPKIELISDLKPEETIGKRATEVFHGEAPFLEIYSKVDETGSPAKFEGYFPSSDRYFSISAFSIGKGQFATIFTDITEQKRMNEELLRAHKQLQDIIDFLPDATFVIDQNRKVIAWNRAIEEMTGVSKEAVMGRDGSPYSISFYGIKRPALIDSIFSGDIEDRYSNVGRKGDAIFAEVYAPSLYGGRGAYIWATASPLFDKDNNIVGAIESIRDVTEIKETEMALQENEERMKLVIEGASLGIWDRNVATGEVVRNRRLVEIFGCPEDELTGHVWDRERRIHPDDFEKVMAALRDHFDGKAPYFEIDYRLKRRDGRWIWVHDRGEVMTRDEEGRPIRMAGITQDITEIRQYQDSLKEANRKLNLLSSVTRHDILNQIMGLSGYALLLSEILPEAPAMKKYVDRVMELADTIRRQVVFTRDYQDMGVKAPEWQSVEEVAGRAAESALFETAKDQIELDITTGGLEVFADPMLEKVFINLLENAARHGEWVRRIRVSFVEKEVGGEGEGEGANDGVIIVEDDGVGIPSEMKAKIFDQAFGRHTGYGLFLSQEILGISGMTINETGDEGKGARFEISVPRENYRWVSA
jgi:PAS domain S-box-containing protein